MDQTDTLHHSLFRGTRAVRNAFNEYIYTGPVRVASRRLGADSVLRSVDSKLTKRTPFDVPNGELTVGETTCTFYLDSMREREWFEKYPESDGSMPVLTDLVERVRPDDDFWDIGANVGIYSCMGASMIKSGSVTAIEPHPKNANRITTNLRRNGLDGTVYRLAFAAESGEIELYVSQIDVAGSYGSVNEDNHQGERLIIEATSGDSFRTRDTVPDPTIVKIDVEGAEHDVLLGMRQTLSVTDCRLVYCNVCSGMTDDVDDEDVYRLLQAYGYEIEPIWEWPDGRGHYVRAEK